MKQCFTDKIKALFSKVKVVSNLARQKFMLSFVLGLIKSRKVQFNEVAQHLNEEIKSQCNEVRIQNFFREAVLDYQQVAVLLCLFLHPKKKVRLCIDRTEWDFGKCQVNVLMVMACQGAVSVPLYWELLDNKSGNSATADRTRLIAQCIGLLGKRIGLLIADREFIGHRWLKYLKDNEIAFLVRMPKHHLIERLDQRVQTASDLATEKGLMLRDCLVDGVWGHVYLRLLGNGDLLYLFSTLQARLGQLYKKRWTIEACFQAFKGRGFDLESTHVKQLEKLKKLLALVSIAYAICVNAGIYQHQKVKPIATKKHGYKANSFFRYGLDTIREVLRKGPQAWSQWVDPFLKWLNLRLVLYKY